MISPGSKVSEGQPVMELETDKAVVEVPSSVTGTVKDDQGQGRREDKSRPGHLYSGGWRDAQPEKAKHAPVEHISEQHEAGASRCQRRCRPREKPRRKYFCPTSSPAAPAQIFACRSNWGRSRERSIARRPRRAFRAPSGARAGSGHLRSQRRGPGGRISEDDVKAHAKSLLTRVAAAQSAPGRHFTQPDLPDFTKFGKVERVSMRGVRRKTAQHLWEAGPPFPTSLSRTRPTSRNSSNCAPALRPRPKKRAAR